MTLFSFVKILLCCFKSSPIIIVSICLGYTNEEIALFLIFLEVDKPELGLEDFSGFFCLVLTMMVYLCIVGCN